MAETHRIESDGIAAVLNHMAKQGRTASRINRGPFDLLVDGVFAEVKCKNLPWARLDFIGLTDNQRRAVDSVESFLLFVVCNLAGPGPAEIIEIPSERLKRAQWKVESTHFIYGPQLRTLAGIDRPTFAAE